MLEDAAFASPRYGDESGGGVIPVSYGDDRNTVVRFYLEPVRQGFLSESAGRDIFKDEIYIEMLFPADTKKQVRRPVDLRGKGGFPPDPERFPRAWQAFQRQEQVVHQGTPLEKFAALSASTVKNFKALNIHTVEHLASVSDSVLDSLGTGAREIREKAIMFLKVAEGSADYLRLTTENQRLKEDIAGKQDQIDKLAARLEAIESRK